jgi:hypothetical protein
MTVWAPLLHGRYLLLWGRLEVAGGGRLGPQRLNRLHDLRLLRQEGIPDLAGPADLGVHHLQDLRHRGERLHARVPGFLLHRVLEGLAGDLRVCFLPARCEHDLERIRRRHQDLSKQRIRIERDRCEQLLQLFLAQRPFGSGLCRGSALRRGGSALRYDRTRHWQGHARRNGDDDGLVVKRLHQCSRSARWSMLSLNVGPQSWLSAEACGVPDCGVPVPGTCRRVEANAAPETSASARVEPGWPSGAEHRMGLVGICPVMAGLTRPARASIASEGGGGNWTFGQCRRRPGHRRGPCLACRRG